MRTALIMAAGFTAAFWLGWLPPSFVVPALFVCAFLARSPRNRTNGPRGLYLPAPGSGTLLVSPSGNQGMAERVEMSTGYSTAGPLPVGWEGPTKLAALSRRIGPGFSTVGPSASMATAGFPGPSTDPSVALADAPLSLVPEPDPDCGCGKGVA